MIILKVFDRHKLFKLSSRSSRLSICWSDSLRKSSNAILYYKLSYFRTA